MDNKPPGYRQQILVIEAIAHKFVAELGDSMCLGVIFVLLWPSFVSSTLEDASFDHTSTAVTRCNQLTASFMQDRSNVFFVVRLWAIVGSIFSAILPGILQRYFIFQPGFADVASATRTAYTVAGTRSVADVRVNA